jgi:hypothetical protein
MAVGLVFYFVYGHRPCRPAAVDSVVPAVTAEK